jgi:S-phase kinase-associated protein 1
MAEASSTALTLISSDGQKVQIERKAAERAGIIKDMLQDFDGNSEIPVTDVWGEILKKVVDYLVHYSDTEPRELPKPLPSADLREVTDEWDVKFIDINNDTIFDIINAANFLSIKPLLDLSCAKIAVQMKGKTAQEIRDLFGIENDLSEEELKEYEEYQI